MCIRTGNPGRPCLGSMAPGDYSNSSNKEKKSATPIADALIAKNKAERNRNTIIENYYYQNSLKEDN